MKAILVGLKGHVALVDDDVFYEIAAYSWTLHPGGYAIRHAFGTTIYMHREILAAPRGKEVDHRNLDKLDNRRENLRLATRRQQVRNLPRQQRGTEPKSSQYRGVWREGRRWRAMLRDDGEGMVLGSFKTEREAALAYDAAIVYRFGPDVRLNIPSVKQEVSPAYKSLGHVGLAGRDASETDAVKLGQSEAA